MRILTTNLLNLARRDDGINPQWTHLDTDFLMLFLRIMN